MQKKFLTQINFSGINLRGVNIHESNSTLDQSAPSPNPPASQMCLETTEGMT